MIDDAVAGQLDKAFTYHAPQSGQPERYAEIRKRAHGLAIVMAELAPSSRERSLAFTKLEESVMWANAAIARNE
jgi:hypothetical protein